MSELTPEERANQLADQVKVSVTNLVVDVENLKKVVEFMTKLEAKGYPVADSVVAMNAKLQENQNTLTELNNVLEAKVTEIDTLASTLQDDLPTF